MKLYKYYAKPTIVANLMSYCWYGIAQELWFKVKITQE